MLAISKFRQNFAIIGNFAKTFKISPGPSKFCHFSNFGENFASLATLVTRPIKSWVGSGWVRPRPNPCQKTLTHVQDPWVKKIFATFFKLKT